MTMESEAHTPELRLFEVRLSHPCTLFRLEQLYRMMYKRVLTLDLGRRLWTAVCVEFLAPGFVVTPRFADWAINLHLAQRDAPNLS